jgi:hypothetical protein
MSFICAEPVEAYEPVWDIKLISSTQKTLDRRLKIYEHEFQELIAGGTAA